MIIIIATKYVDVLIFPRPSILESGIIEVILFILSIKQNCRSINFLILNIAPTIQALIKNRHNEIRNEFPTIYQKLQYKPL